MSEMFEGMWWGLAVVLVIPGIPLVVLGSYGLYVVSVRVGGWVFNGIIQFRSTRTPPPPGPTPPPAPPARSVWGTRILLGIAGGAVVGALTYLFLLYGEEVRKMVPALPEIPDVPLPQSRGEVLQWIEGIEWRWSALLWAVPYIAIPVIGYLSHTCSRVGEAKTWSNTLQVMVFTLLTILAFQEQAILIAIFVALGAGVNMLLEESLMFGMHPPYLLLFFGVFPLWWMGLTQDKKVVKSFFLALLASGFVVVVYSVFVSITVNYTLLTTLLVGLGLFVERFHAGYAHRASLIGMTTAFLIALLHT